MPYFDRPLLILKIGGAAITDKEHYRTLNRESLIPIARTIRLLYTLGYPLILIHGAGSYGHYEAKQYKLNSKIQDDKDKQTMYGVAKCRSSLLRLHSEIVDILVNDENLPVLTVPVFSLPYDEPLHRCTITSSTTTKEEINVVERDKWKDTVEKETDTFNIQQNPSSVTLVPAYVNAAITILREGGIPILHGDPVLVSSESHTHTSNMRTMVISGDTIVDVFTSTLHNYTYRIEPDPLLSTINQYRWKVPCVLFVTGSDGVFNYPPSLPQAQLFHYVYVNPLSFASLTSSSSSSSLSSLATEDDVLIRYENTIDLVSYTTVRSRMQTSTVGADVTGGIQAKLQYGIDMVKKHYTVHRQNQSEDKNEDSFMVSIIGVPVFTTSVYEQLVQLTEPAVASRNRTSISLTLINDIVRNQRGTHILHKPEI